MPTVDGAAAVFACRPAALHLSVSCQFRVKSLLPPLPVEAMLSYPGRLYSRRPVKATVLARPDSPREILKIS